ncbi:A24 family peptidase [Sinanaerobacter sp. ZZT-01]|uniref:A24 family peptidase n=1 Tax=Sinanaerobacter sp. ZZT-01 TaxID=3111540 RepID=UPI002D790695|nr:A24 family peptidase [Sinanaerobacter sp. ZZT-01]WRR94249.1 A24 family peptidase [Sinanaerobacter sp. ZZT-01]
MNVCIWMLSVPILAYGAYQDWKYRIVPNKVPAGLAILAVIEMIISIFGNNNFFISVSISERIFGVIVPALILFLLYVVQEDGIGGGDYKLIIALGALIGATQLSIVAFVACLIALCYCFMKQVRSVPFAIMVFVGYIFLLIFREI